MENEVRITGMGGEESWKLRSSHSTSPDLVPKP